MRFSRSRRAMLTAALASPALLASCGGGESIVSRFSPSRVLLVDGGGNSWGQDIRNRYGSAPTVVPTGGTDYSLGATPIGAGLGATTLAQRVDLLLAGGVGGNDLVVLSGGLPDLVALANGTQSTAAASDLGKAMADQVRRLVNAGATRVLVGNPYNLARSPLFRGGPREAIASGLTRAFNDRLKVSMVDLGGTVLLFDVEDLVDRIAFAVNNGSGFANFRNASAPACAGSTVGNGSVSGSTCTSGAFGGNDPGVFLFYDPIYLTEYAQTYFGEQAFNLMRRQW